MTGPAPRREGWVLALLAVAQGMIAVDYNIVYVALPTIGRDLHLGPGGVQWVVSAYSLAFGGCLLLGGRAADRLGRRRVFTGAVLLYAASSAAGGLAGTPGLLIGARGVQGLAGALLFPATLSLVTTTFAEGPVRNRALAAWGAAGAGGGALGVLLGGVITSTLGWRWTLFVNVPVATAAALLAPVLLPDDRARASQRACESPGSRRSRRPGRRGALAAYDVPGAVTATGGTVLLVHGLARGPEQGWASAPTVLSLVLAAAALCVFVAVESRSATPLVPLRLFANPSLSTAAAVAGLFAASFGVQLYLLTTWLQEVEHRSPLAAGLAYLPLSVSIVVGTRIGGRLSTRLGARTTLVLGLLVGALGMLLIGLRLSPGAAYAALLPGVVVSGLGQGTSFTTMWVAASTGVPAGDAGVASGIASTVQQVGVGVGLAVAVAVVHGGPGASAAALSAGLRDAFLVGVGAAVLAAVLSAALLGGRAPARPPRSAAAGGAEA